MNNLTALVLVVMLLCLAACGSGGAPPDPTVNPETSGTSSAVAAQGDAASEGESTALPEGSSVPSTTPDGTGGTSTAPAETQTAAAQAKLPQTKAEILAAYTAVVNKVKTDMPLYYNNDWQTVSNVDMSGGTYALLSTAAKAFLEPKEESNPGTHQAGTHAEYFALPTETHKVACVLTDTSKIESASCTQSGDAYIIKITLAAEKDPDRNRDNPYAVKGWHGRIFDVMEINQVTDYAKKIPGLNADNAYCTYKGTATLKYNPKTNECISLDHIVDVRVFLGSGAAKVIADYHFYGFVW